MNTLSTTTIENNAAASLGAARVMDPSAGAARFAAAKAALASGKTVSNNPEQELSFAEAYAADSSAFEFELDAAENINDDPASAANTQGYTAGWKPAPVAAPTTKAAPKAAAAPVASPKPVFGGYIALGYDGADNVIWSNMRNCVVRLKAAEINLPVMETWAGLNWVMSNYMDASGDEKKASKLNVGRMRSDLIADCQAAGPFDAAAVYGAGIWEVKVGDERVVVCNSRGQAFKLDGSPMPRITEAGIFAECRSFGLSPTTRSATDDEVTELATAIESWNWRNPADSLLVLGWIAASPFAGVLDRRPGLFITGARGCGKSTLLDTIKGVLGPSAVKADGADSTAAGIRQFMRSDARPLILDEFGDNDSDSVQAASRVKAIISAIRTAYSDDSGEGVIKGTSDGAGANYSTRYMTLVSAIVPPPMQPADRSRFAICTLAPLRTGSVEPSLVTDTDALADLGDRIRMRMFRAWPAVKASLRHTRYALRAGGREARFADTFGTLLAAWYVLTTGQALDAVTARMLVTNTDLSSHAAALAGASDERECADWMLGYTVQGSAYSVGELIKLVSDGKKEHARALETIGMKIADDQLQVCGLKSLKGLRELFSASKFANGGWKIVLERVPGAKPCRPRFNGVQTPSVAVPLSWLFDEPEQTKLFKS